MVRALPSLALGLLVLGGLACLHKDLNPGRCNSTSDCPAGQTCDLSPQANGTCVCGSSSCDGGAGATGSGRGGVGGTITHDGGGAAGAAGQGCQSNAQCAPPTPACVAAACVQCATSADCADPTRPICNAATNTCQACTSDQECVAKMGAFRSRCVHEPRGRALRDQRRDHLRRERHLDVRAGRDGPRAWRPREGHADDASLYDGAGSCAAFQRHDDSRPRRGAWDSLRRRLDVQWPGGRQPFHRRTETRAT